MSVHDREGDRSLVKDFRQERGSLRGCVVVVPHKEQGLVGVDESCRNKEDCREVKGDGADDSARVADLDQRSSHSLISHRMHGKCRKWRRQNRGEHRVTLGEQSHAACMGKRDVGFFVDYGLEEG